MLVNGAEGIAVGMATRIPPHNLGEVVDATLALIENPDLDIYQLMDFIPAPDFPTGGLILGQSGAKKAYLTGRGSVIIRAKTRVEEIRKDRYAIIVEQIPYQVNKLTMIERIGEMARDKKIEGIAPRPGRERPPWRAGGDRAETGRDGGCRPEPALPFHAPPDELRLQPSRAQRRAAGAA